MEVAVAEEPLVELCVEEREKGTPAESAVMVISAGDSAVVNAAVLASAMEKMRVCPTLTLLGSSPSFVSEPMARIFPSLDRDIDEALLCCTSPTMTWLPFSQSEVFSFQVKYLASFPSEPVTTMLLPSLESERYLPRLSNSSTPTRSLPSCVHEPSFHSNICTSP